jgi:hypothetical protein
MTLRKADFPDIPQIEALIARSARGLSKDEYRPSQSKAPCAPHSESILNC